MWVRLKTDSLINPSPVEVHRMAALITRPDIYTLEGQMRLRIPTGTFRSRRQHIVLDPDGAGLHQTTKIYKVPMPWLTDMGLQTRQTSTKGTDFEASANSEHWHQRWRQSPVATVALGSVALRMNNSQTIGVVEAPAVPSKGSTTRARPA